MNLKKLKIIAPLAALALTSCGGDTDALTSASGQVSSAEALSVLGYTAGGNLASFQALSLNFAAPTTVDGASGSSPTAANWYDTCSTRTPNPGVDADADGIAKEKTYTYNCNNVVDGTTTYNMVGTEYFLDGDDTKSIELGGYSQGFDFSFSYQTTGTTGVSSNYHKGSRAYTPSSTQLTYNQTYTYDVTDTRATAISAKLRSSWNAVYTPTNMASPLTGGTASISGFYGLTGTNANSAPAGWSGTIDVVFQVSSSNLVYDSSCQLLAGFAGGAKFRSGTITMVDGVGNLMVWEFACDSATVKFNGSTIKSYP